MRDRRARRGRNSRDGKGRKATSATETRRGATRKDDEGRRGSRTAALNAVPSDRQHRLLHGSSARSASSFGRSLRTIHTLDPPLLLPFSFVLAWLPWRPCRERKSQHRHAAHGGKHGAAAKTRALVVCVVAARSFTCTAYTSDRAREQRCPLFSSQTANARWSTRCVCLSPSFFLALLASFFYFTSFFASFRLLPFV